MLKAFLRLGHDRHGQADGEKYGKEIQTVLPPSDTAHGRKSANLIKFAGYAHIRRLK